MVLNAHEVDTEWYDEFIKRNIAADVQTIHDVITNYIEIYAKDINWKIIGLDPQPEVACLYYKLTNLKGDEVLGYFTIDLDESALGNAYDILNNWLIERIEAGYVDMMNKQEASSIIQYGKNLRFYVDDIYLDSLDGNSYSFRFCISEVPLKDYPKPGEFKSINEEKGYI